MECYEMKNTREVCWDLHLADTTENVRLALHRPERKNVVLEGNAEWETYGMNYLGLLKLGDRYRLYYRARDRDYMKTYRNRFCAAESTDGKTFTRCTLSFFDYNGQPSNIFLEEERVIDNFSVFYDENPDCPPEERFKALSQEFVWKKGGTGEAHLLYYRSADGLRFEKVGRLEVSGVFDSYNVVFWDASAGEYKLYLRDFHREDGSDMDYVPDESVMLHAYRDVRLSRSKDFVHWTKPERILFSDGDIRTQLYTGMVQRYRRAGNLYFGLPTRYANRPENKANLARLPGWNGQRQAFLDAGSRIGSVFCDVGFMTSRDGLHFDKHNSAYMTTGPERHDNWAYEDGYLAYGFAETVSDLDGAAPELSLYRPEGWYAGAPRIVRHTVRLDGFCSWSSDGTGGVLTTVPLSFTGHSMEINFATSSLGGLRIVICREDGSPIDGFDSGVLFGDSVRRTVDFAHPLSEIAGQTVRLRFELNDAELYSFVFC